MDCRAGWGEMVQLRARGGLRVNRVSMGNR